jgi:tetratricopeptide (TPR) repeat protein
MGDVWFQLVAADDPSRARLVADCGRKVLAEDAIGFETLLQSEPRNPRLHEAAAAIFLSLGQVDRGVSHLETALQIDPESVEAHYNLATARAWQGRTSDAISHLEAVLKTMPTHAGGHVNLGAILRAQGDIAGAAAHLQRAIELDPGSAAAHTNYGGVLVQQGRISQAIDEYRAALRIKPGLTEPLTELAWDPVRPTHPQSLRNAGRSRPRSENARDLQRTGRDVLALDALGAAYANAGRFDDAVRTVERRCS